jgi:hypothetical protein
METPIEKFSAQNKTPATQPGMTAKNLEAFKKFKEVNSVVVIQAQTEIPVSKSEDHEVDVAI